MTTAEAAVMGQGGGRVPSFRWNLPNLLTLGRVLSVPVLMALLTCAPKVPGIDGRPWFTAALVLTIAAGITDSLDGYLARKYQEVTRFGRLSDPVADKLLTTGVFVLLAERGEVAGWIVALILSREFAVMALRLILAAEGVPVSVSRWAKVKTIFQVIAMIGILLPLSLREVAGAGWATIPRSVVVYYSRLSVAAVWVALLLTLATGYQYFRDHWSHLEGGEETP